VWLALIGFFKGWPVFLDLIEKATAAYSERTKEMQEQRISLAQKDMNQAQTPEEIKKATDEEADAIRHL
jgi:hypothetical protein